MANNKLIVMKRYLGSGDEESEEENPVVLKYKQTEGHRKNKNTTFGGSNEINCNGVLTKKKKQKKNNSSIDNTSLFEDIQERETHKKRNKRKFQTLSQDSCSDNTCLSESIKVVEETSKNERESHKKRKKRKSSSLCQDSENTCQSENIKEKDETQAVEKESPKKRKKRKISTVSQDSDNTCQSGDLKNVKKEKDDLKSNKNLQNGVLLDATESENKTEKKADDGIFAVIGQVKSAPKKVGPFLPEWLRNPTVISIDLQANKTDISEISFLDDDLKANLIIADIKYLFPVQHAVIPALISCKKQSDLIRPSDVCVTCPTGSGKTLAFVLPIVQSLKNRMISVVRAVVVLPVHELAFQVYRVFQQFVQGTDLKVTLLTGQKSFSDEQKSLLKSSVNKALSLADIVVTTPRRLFDHIHKTEGFCLQHLQFLVIDEADRVIDTMQKTWLKQLEEAVYSKTHSTKCVLYDGSDKNIYPDPLEPVYFIKRHHMQKLLCSATLSHNPEKMHALSLHKPKLFSTQSKPDTMVGNSVIPPNLSMYSIVCQEESKPLAVWHFIKDGEFKRVLCFTKSVERAQRLHFVLAEMGTLQVREMYSDNKPRQRKLILKQFVSGKVNILVCSDMFARGMDIEGVDCVVSYDFPPFSKSYMHRIGRTARAGKQGVALTVLTEGELNSFKNMLRSSELPMPQQIHLSVEDLEVYVESFKKALKVADTKLRQITAMQRKETKLISKPQKTKRTG